MFRCPDRLPSTSRPPAFKTWAALPVPVAVAKSDQTFYGRKAGRQTCLRSPRHLIALPRNIAHEGVDVIVNFDQRRLRASLYRPLLKLPTEDRMRIVNLIVGMLSLVYDHTDIARTNRSIKGTSSAVGGRVASPRQSGRVK
jgi:hypothetical protein